MLSALTGRSFEAFDEGGLARADRAEEIDPEHAVGGKTGRVLGRKRIVRRIEVFLDTDIDLVHQE